MTFISSCGLNKILSKCKKNFWQIFKYLLNIIYDEDDFLKEIDGLSLSEIFLLLKGDEYKEALNKNFAKKDRRNLNDFHNFGHELGGANFHTYNYHNERIKKLIWQLKFNENKKVANILGFSIYKNICNVASKSQQIESLLASGCLLVPIPIHRKRFFERGYNQCDWLCKSIIHNLKKNENLNLGDKKNFGLKIKYCPKIIKRIKYTNKQSWIKNLENSDKFRIRQKNMRDVFKTNDKLADKYKGYNIVLIDDVFTTGATINEASQTLKKSGFANIVSFTVAR